MLGFEIRCFGILLSSEASPKLLVGGGKIM